MTTRHIFTLLLLFTTLCSAAQSPSQEKKMIKKVEKYFAKYKAEGIEGKTQVLNCKVNDDKRIVMITVDDGFARQTFNEETVEDIYKGVRKKMPKPYKTYDITVVTGGKTIEDYTSAAATPVTASKPSKKKSSRGGFWQGTDYDGNAWVTNMSLPVEITRGLAGRHLSLWASHGLYYSKEKEQWRWQRPRLFGTAEDVFTSTIVVPYLIPMLENAGAIVFTPRERDWQTNELIVDNDDYPHGGTYIEVDGRERWQSASGTGFARHDGVYLDGENPFTAGTARMAETTRKSSSAGVIAYQPVFPEEGRYAVYVSYQTLPASVDDAMYTVWHKGEQTTFRVNQQMGGGTWVYIGTFEFAAGSSEDNRVTLTNISGEDGVVTADAVRFGGGMGNIARGGVASGMPRCVEGSRYYAQWAGMPYSIYSLYKGDDDYKDDINTRSLMTNYIGGGSCFMPTITGLKVPIELSLAIHSDAGFASDGASLIGSLAIYTTDFNDGLLDAGVSRTVSGDLAARLLHGLTGDITYKYGQWKTRGTFDRNYSETRLPAVPSAILETLSHQNFPDMKYGQDPNFRFTLARSIYKTLLRYITESHGEQYVVTPLAPDNFRIAFTAAGEVTLRWDAVYDRQERSSNPDGFIVYTSVGDGGWDNGTYVKGGDYTLDLMPGVLYSFKVAAANDGGISFTTETLCAYYSPNAAQNRDVLIVDGFHRLSSPTVIDNAMSQGFDIYDDSGVSLGQTIGLTGQQQVYDKSLTGINGSSGLGWSGNELAGTVIAGNDRDNVRTHARAIAAAGRYNIVSCSSHAVEKEKVDLSVYDLVDVALGLERDDGHSLIMYKALPSALRISLRAYSYTGGALLVSGAYVGDDMQADDERIFLADVLKCRYTGSVRSTTDSIYGMSTTIHYYNSITDKHYAARTHDTFEPVAPAFAALRYYDATQGNAAVAYKGKNFRTFTLGIPFECIKGEETRATIMRGIVDFLLK